MLLGAPGYFAAFGAYRDGCEIIGRARSEKKELVVVDGWSHDDLYEKPEPVAKALARMIPLLQREPRSDAVCADDRFAASSAGAFQERSALLVERRKP